MTRRAAPTPRAQPKRDEMIKPIETPSLVKHYQDIQRSHLLHGRPGSSAVTPAALSTDGRGGMITGGTRAGSRGGLRAELTPGAATARRDKPRGFLGRPSQVLKAQAVSGGAPLSRLDKDSRRGAFGLSSKEPSDGAATAQRSGLVAPATLGAAPLRVETPAQRRLLASATATSGVGATAASGGGASDRRRVAGANSDSELLRYMCAQLGTSLDEAAEHLGVAFSRDGGVRRRSEDAPPDGTGVFEPIDWFAEDRERRRLARTGSDAGETAGLGLSASAPAIATAAAVHAAPGDGGFRVAFDALEDAIRRSAPQLPRSTTSFNDRRSHPRSPVFLATPIGAVRRAAKIPAKQLHPFALLELDTDDSGARAKHQFARRGGGLVPGLERPHAHAYRVRFLGTFPSALEGHALAEALLSHSGALESAQSASQTNASLSQTLATTGAGGFGGGHTAGMPSVPAHEGWKRFTGFDMLDLSRPSHFVMYCRDTPIELLSFGQRGESVTLAPAQDVLGRPASPLETILEPPRTERGELMGPGEYEEWARESAPAVPPRALRGGGGGREDDAFPAMCKVPAQEWVCVSVRHVPEGEGTTASFGGTAAARGGLARPPRLVVERSDGAGTRDSRSPGAASAAARGATGDDEPRRPSTSASRLGGTAAHASGASGAAPPALRMLDALRETVASFPRLATAKEYADALELPPKGCVLCIVPLYVWLDPAPEKLWAAYGHHFASVPPREKEVAKYIEACKAEATVRVADTRGTVAPDTDNNASVGISAVQMATHAATNKRKDESGASEASLGDGNDSASGAGEAKRRERLQGVEKMLGKLSLKGGKALARTPVEVLEINQKLNSLEETLRKELLASRGKPGSERDTYRLMQSIEEQRAYLFSTLQAMTLPKKKKPREEERDGRTGGKKGGKKSEKDASAPEPLLFAIFDEIAHERLDSKAAMDKTIEPGNHPELERKINTLDRMLVRHRAGGAGAQARPHK